MPAAEPMGPGVWLWWIPLGAGGRFVAWNGRVYEAFKARSQGRPRAALYHSALTVVHGKAHTVIENAWPVPREPPDTRGVAVTGAVFHGALRRFRGLRYEIRRWDDGIIADAAYCDGPVRVARSHAAARRVLELVPQVPPLVWGRRPDGLDDMWNSNSVVAWLLTAAGLDAARLAPPNGGRAPGWSVGVKVAQMRRDAK